MTYQPQPKVVPLRMPLSMSLESRTASTAKDSRIVNGYVETLDDVQYVVKRPGTSSMTYSPTIANAVGYGIKAFNGKLYAGIGTHLYEITSAGATTDKGAIEAGHLSFGVTSQTPYLFLHNSINAWTLNGSTGTLAAVSDIQFPTEQTPALTLAKGAVYLDDVMYVMTTTGRIYNSDVEDPTSWSGDYISKISEPDGGVAIAKHLNFLVAWGTFSGEFFYNAGNASPDSPLDRVPSYKMDIGCACSTSVVEFAQTVAWIGQSEETGRGVYILNGTAPEKVSTAAVERYLNADEGLASVKAFAMTISGHTFYVLNLIDNITLVCDLVEKRWYQWSTDSSGTDAYWQYTSFASLNGVSYLQKYLTGKIGVVSSSIYQDETTNINYRIVSFKIDNKTNTRKFWQHLEIIGDKTAATLQIRHADDDYVTWGDYRTVDLSIERPIIRQLGSSRRRVYEFFSTSNVAIRLQAAEILLKEGTF